MRRIPIWIATLLVPLALAAVLAAAPAVRLEAASDLTIGATGCREATLSLPPDREPFITVVNQAREPMVLVAPRLINPVLLAPGERRQVELPRYIMGDFAFFCLTEPAHTAAGGMTGAEAFVCNLDAETLAPVALSQGILTIEPHNRIQEVLN